MTRPRRPTSPAAARRRAFTLLELILVLVILSVMVAIVVPSLTGVGRNRGADEVTSQIMALCQYGRSQAISDGYAYRLYLDPANRQFQLMVDVGDGTFGELGKEMGQVIYLPEGVSMSFDDAFYLAAIEQGSETGRVAPPREAASIPFVEFKPSGRIDPCRISVMDRDGAVTDIICPSPTETMRLLKPDGSVKF